MALLSHPKASPLQTSREDEIVRIILDGKAGRELKKWVSYLKLYQSHWSHTLLQGCIYKGFKSKGQLIFLSQLPYRGAKRWKNSVTPSKWATNGPSRVAGAPITISLASQEGGFLFWDKNEYPLSFTDCRRSRRGACRKVGITSYAGSTRFVIKGAVASGPGLTPATIVRATEVA